MRFDEMMNRLQQDVSWPMQKIEENSVVTLTPRAKNFSGWLDATNIAETPDEVNGVFLADLCSNVKEIPREFFPKYFRMKSYDYSKMRETRRKLEWPSDVPQVMPDFYSLNDCLMVVSREVREFIDAVSPNCAKYTHVEIEFPDNMEHSDNYYFIDVLSRAQMVDWPNVDRKKFQLDRFDPNNPRPLPPDESVPFRPIEPGSPLIWHEMSLDRMHRFAQAYILIRGRLWNYIINRFDQQLL